MFDRTQRAEDVLRRAAGAMGADALKTVRYLTSGSEFIFGQSAKPGGPWPKYGFESMVTCLNYESGCASEQITGQRVRAETRGGGEPSLPRGTTFVADGFTWSQAGDKSFPGPWHADNRNHQIWITPHGFIKAATKNQATLQWHTEGERTFACLSFIEPGRFAATAFLNEEHLIERVESRVRITYCGEVDFVTSYSDYRDFGSFRFPTRIQRSQAGFPILDATVAEVQPNVAFDVEVPDAVRQPRPRPAAVKVADGVWRIPGSHHCAAIEMKDHIVVVEAPLISSAAAAVFEAAKEAIPGKPIRYVITTHHHIDHAGGLRAAVAEGATIVTHVLNRPLFQRYFASPNTLGPDESVDARTAAFVTVNEMLLMSDGERMLEIHHVRGNEHAEDLIMVYLPREKLLIEADAFSPGPPDSPLSAQPESFAVNLVENIDRLRLSIERILPMHGPIVPLEQLYRALGRTVQTRPEAA
jgi:glyoxylase-like metal-dependent hydrolase (beta-lactamase superfamily II)